MRARRAASQNIKTITGYVLFCLLVFIPFLYLLLPREAIINRIIYEIENNTASKINTSGEEWIFPLGIAFKDMEFTRREGNSNHILTRIERLDIEMPLKGIVSLSPVTVLTADIYGGTAKGLLTLSNKDRVVQANWTDVDMSRIEGLKEIPIEIMGRLSGDLLVRLRDNIPEGELRLLIKDGKLSKIKILGFSFPDIPVDEVQGIVDIKGYTLSLKDVRFKNSDIKGTIKGDLQLGPQIGSGSLDISIRFAVGEKIRKDQQALLSFIERSKDREGYYTIKIKGDIKKPTFNI